jgi:hypothetical protein
MAALYRDIIRSYSRTVSTGHSDTDLTPRQRRLVHVLLNLASNDATAPYPPTDTDRVRAVKRLGEIMWDARPLLDALAPGKSAQDDVQVALDRAIEVLRSV